jgi:MFS family permease
VHQIALGVLVYQATGSALGVGLVFLSATLPNLLVGPIAGTLVDRWGAKEVMIASDLLRAGLVLLLPLAVAVNIAWAYPLVFLITAVSMFFRPARFAVIPKVVDKDDLQPANSASWIAESLADIVGYPLAGLFVAFLAANLALAFFFDSATYVGSAILILGVTIPPFARVVSARAPGLRGAVAGFRDELVGGWRFLRGERALFANTLISMVGQLSIGATIALTVVYARDVLDGRLLGYPANYAALDGAIGLGNLLGGFAVGLLTARIRRGWLIGLGYLAMGVFTVLLAATGNVLAAAGLMFGTGVANMVFVIPTQTLFHERVPEDFMGRVIGFRFSVVFGSITLAMGISGYMATVVGVAAVFALFGGLTAVAGLIALALPAVRDA